MGLAFAGITATGPWDSNIWVIAAAIGLTTFACTTTGMLIGKRIGVRFGKLAERVGGVALIGLGTLILLEHLGMLGAEFRCRTGSVTPRPTVAETRHLR